MPPPSKFESVVPESDDIVQEISAKIPKLTAIARRLARVHESKRRAAALADELARTKEKLAYTEDELAKTKGTISDSERVSDALLTPLCDLSQTVRMLTGARLQGTLLLRERFQGKVLDATDQEFAVAFETAEGTFDQVYHRSQLASGCMPTVGDPVIAIGLLFAAKPGERRSLAEILSEDDEFPTFEEESPRGGTKG